MEKINKAIEILQAFNEGKKVEYFHEEKWHEVLNLDIILDYAKYNIRFLRIAKEPTYRPYANVEEFLKASKEHGPYLSNRIPIQYANDGVFLYSDIDDDSFDLFKWETLFNTGCRWQDGTPCGILEE